MNRDPITLVASAALGIWSVATVTVGALYHFGQDGEKYHPWVFPMCMVTFMGALLVGRLSKSRGRRR